MTEYSSQIALVAILLLLAFLIPAVLFLRTQYTLLKLIKPENRTIQPGMIFLQLIPLVNLIVQFFVVTGISNSLAREAGTSDDDSILGMSVLSAEEAVTRPTLKIGIAYCILLCLSTSINIGTSSFVLAQSSALKSVFSLGAIICWIIYWVDILKYKNRLKKQFV